MNDDEGVYCILIFESGVMRSMVMPQYRPTIRVPKKDVVDSVFCGQDLGIPARPHVFRFQYWQIPFEVAVYREDP